MKRDYTNFLSYVLDHFVPPIFRENRIIYGLLLKLVVKGDVDSYLDFRDNAWRMSPEDFKNLYDKILSNIDRPTDCNQLTLDAIYDEFENEKYLNVLEFGCGRGYLASQLISKFDVEYVGIDFDVTIADEALPSGTELHSLTSPKELKSERMFDCVISTHTLEHVIDVREIFDQLWGKCRKDLIIVVPMQLNLKFTPDLHTRHWRRFGDFFLDAGIVEGMNPVWAIYGRDLYVKLSK